MEQSGIRSQRHMARPDRKEWPAAEAQVHANLAIAGYLADILTLLAAAVAEL